MQVLQGLLAAIPSFWTNEEIVPVINMYFQYEKDGVVLLAALGKSVAKRIPSSTLLPALFTVFKSWETSEFPSVSVNVSCYFCELFTYP
jgi:U3 small nucleolar RNA-associated protein 10